LHGSMFSPLSKTSIEVNDTVMELFEVNPTRLYITIKGIKFLQ